MADSILIDPLGRKIILGERTWCGHILRSHPDLKDDRALVEGAIRSPEQIRHSRSDADCRFFFGPGPDSSHRMIVVVYVVLGTVKTAHLARKLSGGLVEWSS